jgi:hypothetical protein
MGFRMSLLPSQNVSIINIFNNENGLILPTSANARDILD